MALNMEEVIGRLYANILYDDIQRFQITPADIRTGIQNMKEVYKPDPTSLSSGILEVANYNDVAHRCAYLHKYAPLHTALVSEMLARSFQMQSVKKEIEDILIRFGRIDVCSLGGGPGSDILGVITVLSSIFGFFQISATIIDCMGKWQITFNSLINELRQGGNYGILGEIVQPQYFHWNYIEHDLVGKMTDTVNRAIQGAHLITMVKFVSAAACKDTSIMLKKIFRSLKPGALVLYIDNAGGGFHPLISKCAQDCGMLTVFGPLKHENYANSNFNVVRFGYTPCLETTVSVHIWRKSNWRNQSFPLSPEYLGDVSSTRITVTNTSNTINQYNIINQNYHAANTNNSNLPRNNRQSGQNNRGRSRSRSRSRSRNRYRAQAPIQRQPQYQTLPDDNTSNQHYVNEGNRNWHENDDEQDCSCCVIS